MNLFNGARTASRTFPKAKWLHISVTAVGTSKSVHSATNSTTLISRNNIKRSTIGNKSVLIARKPSHLINSNPMKGAALRNQNTVSIVISMCQWMPIRPTWRLVKRGRSLARNVTFPSWIKNIIYTLYPVKGRKKNQNRLEVTRSTLNSSAEVFNRLITIFRKWTLGKK